jgi:hypothetical protein
VCFRIFQYAVIQTLNFVCSLNMNQGVGLGKCGNLFLRQHICNLCRASRAVHCIKSRDVSREFKSFVQICGNMGHPAHNHCCHQGYRETKG